MIQQNQAWMMGHRKGVEPAAPPARPPGRIGGISAAGNGGTRKLSAAIPMST